MNIPKRSVPAFFTLATLVVSFSTLVVAAGCGNGSLSPSAPSVLSGSGSVISGQINGGTAQTGGSLSSVTAATTGAGMTVTAEGTGKSTTADSAGRFMLTGLPEGRLQLRFTGSGADARLPISVARSERVDIVVRVEGTRATLESERHMAVEGEDEDEAEIKGVVANRGGTCPSITFTVNGAAIMTNSSTKFEDGTCAQVVNGARVEVEGGPPMNGVILATKVEVYY